MSSHQKSSKSIEIGVKNLRKSMSLPKIWYRLAFSGEKSDDELKMGVGTLQNFRNSKSESVFLTQMSRFKSSSYLLGVSDDFFDFVFSLRKCLYWIELDLLIQKIV